MKRALLIALLSIGTVGGYAAGFASLRYCHHARRVAFERHVARICADAARNPDRAPDAQNDPFAW